MDGRDMSFEISAFILVNVGMHPGLLLVWIIGIFLQATLLSLSLADHSLRRIILQRNFVILVLQRVRWLRLQPHVAILVNQLDPLGGVIGADAAHIELPLCRVVHYNVSFLQHFPAKEGIYNFVKRWLNESKPISASLRILLTTLSKLLGRSQK